VFIESRGKPFLRTGERPDRDDDTDARLRRDVSGHGLRMLPAVEPVYAFVRGALVPPMHRGMKWTIEGAHRVAVHGPVILASNHVSYLDPLVLGYLADRRHRKVRFLAKRELFDKRGLGFILRHARQIPVARNTAGAAGSLDAAVDALRTGECVCVFPEGTISLDLEPMVGKTGTARLAAESGVPVTPVGLWGAQRILFKGRKPRWRSGIAETVVVGERVRVAPDEDAYAATDRIMAAIAACVRRAREIYPQRPATGEDDWWVRAPGTAVVRPANRDEAPVA
jgi:1-acyl-sn-glycerol-3-phosphate acyltransferase